MKQWAKRKRGEPKPPKQKKEKTEPPPKPKVDVYPWWDLNITCLGGGDHRHYLTYNFKRKKDAEAWADKATESDGWFTIASDRMRTENISTIVVNGPYYRKKDGGHPGFDTESQIRHDWADDE